LSRIGGQSEIASEIWIGRASALRLIGSLREYNVGMSKEIVSIPGCLSEWIEQNMPELGGMGGVRILCCDRLPFQWVPGFMPNIVGITLWNTIYLRRTVCPIDPNDPAGTSLLFHELVHVGQFRRGPIAFPVRYLIDLIRVGYCRIPAEQEARDRASELSLLYHQDRPCDP